MSSTKGMMPSTPNFLEDDLLIFVTRILERSTNHTKYIIRPASKHLERKFGYDVSVDAMCQIYMQFKVGKYAHQSNSKFIKGRIPFAFDDALGVMHFGLREPPATISDPKELQHNCLFRLSLIYPGRVIYVAPTFTDEELLSPLAIPWNFPLTQLRPFMWKKSSIRVGKLNFVGPSIPILQNLISIFPHEPVKTHKHSYAYNFSGEVSFHSKANPIPKGSRRFLSLISGVYNQAMFNEEDVLWENRDQIERTNSELVNQMFGSTENLVQKLSVLDEPNKSTLRQVLEPDSPFHQRWAIDSAMEKLLGIRAFSLVKLRKL